MKDLKTNSRTNFEEILFENRNKQYGAYALRRESDAVLTKALFVGLGLLASITVIPFAVKAFSDVPVPDETPFFPPGPITIIEIPNDDISVTPVRFTPPVDQNVQSVDTRVPEPTKRVNGVEKGAATITERQNAIQGTTEQAGNSTTVENVSTSNVTIGTTSGSTTTVIVDKDPIDLKKINTTVDVQATYKGGIDNFRNEIMKRFPVDDFADEGGAIRVTINFVVETDGTISQITATGPNASFNAEAIKTIKKVKGAWEPAKIKGTSVRSYFKFPIVMNFE